MQNERERNSGVLESMKDEKKFVNDYLSDLSSLVQPEENLVNKLLLQAVLQITLILKKLKN